MIVQCIIGPDPRSETIHMGQKLWVSQESSPFSFVIKSDSEPNIQCVHHRGGGP